MSNPKDIPFQSLKFYATAPYPCSYLANHSARSQVATPPQLVNSALYDQLINLGFRRSGLFTYRPYCDHCQACVATRIPVAAFNPSRSQLRAWKKYQSMDVHILPLDFSNEHFELYEHYQNARHAESQDSAEISDPTHRKEQYKQFLLQSNIESILVEFREDGILRMVSIVDVLYDGLSSVYTFYDTSKASSSFGTFGIMWQIEQAKMLKLNYVFLGYYIEQSTKMSYKSQYRPLEGLVKGQWTTIFA